MSAIEKTLLGVGHLIEGILSSETDERKGFLHSVDPRVKIVGLVVVLFTVSIVRDMRVLSLFFLVALLLVFSSRISITRFMRQLFFPATLFTLLIALPATLNIITPGDPIVPFFGWKEYNIAVTRQGLRGSALFFLRAMTSFSFVLLVSLSTRWTDLLKGLRVLKVPQVFVMTCEMTYQYLFLLVRLVEKMCLARRSRTLRPLPAGQERGWVAARMGALVQNSIRLSTGVHQAMLSRGYGGEIGLMGGYEKRGRDEKRDGHVKERETVFELERASFSYPPGIQALQEVTLSIGSGEKVMILGANGSGKSTLLHLLDALIFPSSGVIRFCGEVLSGDMLEGDGFRVSFRKRVGFLFQEPDVQLFSPTVWDEVIFGPLQLDCPESEIHQKAEDLLRMLEIRGLRERSPHTLSGGEKKRVCIASLLSLDPDILLLDEPTGGLDPRTQKWFIELLIELHRAGKTIVSATHDLSIVEDLADRVIVMSEGHTIRAEGPPQQILADQDLLLSVNLIHEHIHRHGASSHQHTHAHSPDHEHGHGVTEQ